jgi:probable rRNA maturation factor
MTVLFENECGMTFDFPMQEQLELLVQTVTDFTGCPYETEVSVVLVDKDEIHRANREFRQVDRPTDVLSFPMMEYDSPAAFDGAAFLESAVVSPESNELVLGDIMLCAPVVCEQAKEYGHSEIREFSFLVVHSLLHLFGYDHMEEAERKEMEDAQRKIMDMLKIVR